jgi:hypothetical protein
MQGDGDNILPYLLNELGDLLGISIVIDAGTIKIEDIDDALASIKEIQAA